jgi:ferredoxin
MVPFRNGLVIPEVNQDLCTGCGACEYVCPVRPFRAIYVEGILKHETAKLPVKKEAGKVERNREAAGKDDFPF